MKFHYLPVTKQRVSSDAYVIPCVQEDEGGFSTLFPISKELLEVISPLKKLNDFSAKKGEVLILYQKTVYSARTILLGLGPLAKLDSETLREAYAKLVMTIGGKKFQSIITPIPDIEGKRKVSILMEMMEGLMYGSYQFTKYKDSEVSFPDVSIPYDSIEEFSLALERTIALMNGITLARDLINMNACDHCPQKFGEYVLENMPKGLIGTLHNEQWIEKERMRLLLAVGQASSTPPRVLTLTWKPLKKSKDHTVLVGKGITFDTGGLNLKPTGSIETMRDDMSGAAAVAAVLCTLAEMNVEKNVTAVIPLAENAIDGKSMKPGDIFKARSGDTVEIINTDAEGRLILADALNYVIEELKPSRVIDVATLTGACELVFGPDIFAIFSNSDSFSYEIERAALRAGESAWRMPLYENYRELLKSEFADMKNGPSSRNGGMIVSALFLENFVNKTPWIHLDIAGTATHKEASRYLTKGATGSPVRTLIEYFNPVY